MSIPVFNFRDLHHQKFQDEILTRFSKIVAEGSFIEGKYNDLFESEFAKLHLIGTRQVRDAWQELNGRDGLQSRQDEYDGLNGGACSRH